MLACLTLFVFAIDSNLVNSFFQGGLWILLIYNLLLYIQTRQKFNLVYSGYLFFVSLNFLNIHYNLVTNFLYKDLQLFDDGVKLETYYFESFMYIFYFLFIKSYLGDREKYKKIYLLLSVMIANSVLEIIITNFLFSFSQFNIALPIISCLKVLNMICAIGLIPLFYRQYNQLISYLFFGGTALLIGTLLYFSTLQISFFESSSFLPVYFLYLGISIELLIFSLGIGYRYRLIQDEKLEIQAKLLDEYKNRQHYYESLNMEMEDELRTRLYEIKFQEQEIFKGKLEKERIVSQLQLKSIQMNPHFVFNSLNVIKGIYLKNGNPLEYIYKLSKMIRSIFYYSDRKMISIDDELLFIEEYIKLQNDSLTQKIQFEIEIADEIDTEVDEIPPMILQPLVENAIWHGLAHSLVKSPIISLKFFVENERIMALLSDNGIGRKAAENYRNSNKNLSMASTIISERLEFLSSLNERKFSFQYKDLYDKNGNSLGTEVLLCFG